jgi:hypothetical protein
MIYLGAANAVSWPMGVLSSVDADTAEDSETLGRSIVRIAAHVGVERSRLTVQTVVTAASRALANVAGTSGVSLHMHGLIAWLGSLCRRLCFRVHRRACLRQRLPPPAIWHTRFFFFAPRRPSPIFLTRWRLHLPAQTPTRSATWPDHHRARGQHQSFFA